MKKKAILISTAMLSLYGCTTADGQYDRARTAGLCGSVGAIAGVAGVFGKSNRSNIIGGLATAAACQLVGELRGLELSKQDELAIEETTQQVAVSGETKTYENPETGVKSSVKVTETRPQQVKTAQVKVLKDRVEQTPALDLVKAPYETVSAVNVRGGPGTGYKEVGHLTTGEVRDVIGKVQGKPWYLISEGNVGTGYVYASLMRPTTQAAPPLNVAGSVSSVQIETNTSCRVVEREVAKEGYETVTQKFEMCQQEDGSWDVTNTNIA